MEEKLLAVDMVYASAGPTVEQDGFVYPAGDYEGEAVPEAYLHDSSQLPHLIGGDLRLLFPSAVPAVELEELPEEPDWLEQRATASRCERAMGQATVESLRADIRAANALIAKAALSAEDVSAATALIAKSEVYGNDEAQQTGDAASEYEKAIQENKISETEYNSAHAREASAPRARIRVIVARADHSSDEACVIFC